jgi:ribosomal protein S27AE
VKDCVVCVPARFRSLIRLASVDRTCARCGEAVLLAACNEKIAANMEPICIACALKEQPEMLANAGGVANGQRFPDLITSIRAAKAAENRN